ncbi:MAG: GNAT family N-acetyltransferase, partial [Thermoleophilia bacterium]|nr:GNAT family N-acetyltransferase [Thermoleophilia bacterium]
TPLRLRLTEGYKELPAVEAVLYLDKKGRIVQPPLNPYSPVAFYPTATDKVPRLYRQWAVTSGLLAEEFARRGVKGAVALPPEVTDVRQWQWRGFVGEVRYTFYLDLPHEIEAVDHSERNKVNKAGRGGFSCEIAPKDAYTEVVACLAETEARQGFSHRLSTKDLEVALDLLGADIFRVYVCRDGSSEVACARIVISAPGLRAVDWVAGTKTRFLRSGCTQFLIWYVLNDLAHQGAAGFDFAGANLPTVSAAKADWGGTLAPYYAVRPLNLRTLGGWLLKALGQARKRG